MEETGSGDLNSLLGNMNRHQSANLFSQAKMLMSAPKIKKNLEKLKESYIDMKTIYQEQHTLNISQAEQLIKEFEKLRSGVTTIAELLSGNEDAISALSLLQGAKGAASGMEKLINAPLIIDEYISSIKAMITEYTSP